MKNELICYKQMPVWTKDKLPQMFQEKHNTKVGTWGKLTVLKGKLKFYELNENGDVITEHIFTPESDIPFVEPQIWHRIEALFFQRIGAKTLRLYEFRITAHNL